MSLGDTAHLLGVLQLYLRERSISIDLRIRQIVAPSRRLWLYSRSTRM